MDMCRSKMRLRGTSAAFNHKRLLNFSFHKYPLWPAVSTEGSEFTVPDRKFRQNLDWQVHKHWFKSWILCFIPSMYIKCQQILEQVSVTEKLMLDVQHDIISLTNVHMVIASIVAIFRDSCGERSALSQGFGKMCESSFPTEMIVWLAGVEGVHGEEGCKHLFQASQLNSWETIQSHYTPIKKFKTFKSDCLTSP